MTWKIFLPQDNFIFRRLLMQESSMPVLSDPRILITSVEPAMDEQEWLTTTDVRRMLEHLRIRHEPGGYDPPSDRKLRLFAVACCRAVWDGVECKRCAGQRQYKRYAPDDMTSTMTCEDCQGTGKVGGITDPRSRHAVEVAEKYADGLATEDEMDIASGEQAMMTGEWIALWASYPPGAFSHALQRITSCVGGEDATKKGPFPTPAAQANLLRDIIGNPFKPVIIGTPCSECVGRGRIRVEGDHGDYDEVCCPVCDYDTNGTGLGTGTHKGRDVPWLTPTVTQLAETIYQDHTFDHLPILADLLEESGCDNADILNHCRGQEKCPHCGGRGKVVGSSPRGEHDLDAATITVASTCGYCGGLGCTQLTHARGCWVLDLLTGRN